MNTKQIETEQDKILIEFIQKQKERIKRLKDRCNKRK
tara:strand:+ start:383 stop:493 length:111 start_codon:yes stop_codon:yes gene_type:complete